MVSITSDNDNMFVINQLKLTIQESMLLKLLEEFYKNENNYSILKSIIGGDNLISRRTIEYFVTKYSNNENTNYTLNLNGKTTKFNVYSSYKDKLKCHKKKYFDPFGRGDRIPFFTNSDCIITTIGQLNFYKWFISKKIYDYCIENHSEIQNSLLNNFSKKVKKQTGKKIPSYYKSVVRPQYSAPMNLSVSFDI